MPIELFGFKLGKKQGKKSTQPEKKLESFVAPDRDEGATYVDGGGYFSAFIDFDAEAKTDIEFISKYREWLCIQKLNLLLKISAMNL